MEKQYAQAIYELSKKPGTDADAIVKQVIAHLKATGREKLLPRIGRELRRLEARTESFGELLEVASEHERAAAEREAKAEGINTKALVNPMLVTGWRARSGSRVIDRSGKRVLLDLYRDIALNA